MRRSRSLRRGAAESVHRGAVNEFRESCDPDMLLDMTSQASMPQTADSAVPYTSQSFAQTHPRRLATIAWLHGVTTAPPENCRVLELGCASGGNLLPMAWQLPNSRFVGVDISTSAIRQGETLAHEFRLRNIEFLRHDIAEPITGLGEFDFIIAHGLLSWIAPDVQRRFWEWLNIHLAPRGVAYVSYNAMPGWSFRGAVRDLMQFAADPRTSPAEQVAAGRRLLEQAARSRPPERSPFGPMLAAEVRRIEPQPDDYVWHEFLGSHNRPCYFREFVDTAESHGLQFLGEADYGSEATVDLPTAAIAQLPSADVDWLRREQLLDFLRWQPFRQSLLCRRDVAIARTVDASRIESLFVAADLTVESGSESNEPAQSLTFVGRQSRVTTNHPITKAALNCLTATFPRFWSFDGLLDECVRQVEPPVGPADARRELAESLLRAYATRLIELSPDQPVCGRSDSERPQASTFVRRSAVTGASITNRLHQSVAPDGFQRFVLTLLDGRPLAEVSDALVEQTRHGVTLVDEAGQPIVDDQRIRDVLLETLARTLRQLARLALLEPAP